MNFPSQPAFYRWRPATWLRVTGSDAATFLQGQFTNDLRGAAARAVYGLWLNVKGKVVADSFVRRAGDAFWIGSYFSPATVVRERLDSFVIADDVTIEDQTDAWSGVTLFGQPEAALPSEAARQGALSFAGRRVRAPHTEWVFPHPERATIEQMLHGWTEIDERSLEQARIDDGIPAVPRDIGPADLPNEGGLETDAISYHKGCYLGQEVMARLKSMGQVRRRLLRVRGDDDPPPPLPAALYADGKRVGELRSAVSTPAGLHGLALLSLLHLTPAAALALAPDGPATLHLAETP